ncbi:helix-turn-helix domain-containing protein [Actinocorallia sp. A-T 12471]|uniref:TetR/AcrR family transcriptional regulator n=1 Tax=Actinocorallia sp. A-T 12471 TaxID=3089813 RepID=UPI0029CBB585|nr:helix-turn-helix domain-containing protein [Actinocorallia sp. A-T 12471]MDX6743010.1 helix-turn-helix domain-containing protein [Actinocorallia sp. A-T 12471]
MSTSTRPLRKDAARNRARILAAARALFAERGLDVTLEEVARTAGVGIGTVYRRFPAREDLIEAVVETQHEELRLLAEDALAEPDPWTGLERFLQRFCDEHLTDRGLRQLILAPGDVDRLAAALGVFAPPVELLLERAKRAGAVRADLGFGDLTLLLMAVATIAEHTRHIPGRPWLRHHALVLEGLRPAPTSLPVAPLAGHELNAAIRDWIGR